MSNLKYKIAEFEEPANQKEGGVYGIKADRQRPRPFLVADNVATSGNLATQRTSEILDYLLANGSMPA